MQRSLEDILENINFDYLQKGESSYVNGLSLNSKEITKGFAFIAVKGTKTDGHKFIDQAIKSGANTIIGEHLDSAEIANNATVNFIKVENSQKAVGQIASNFYESPSDHLKIIAITGTNGKTSTANFLYQTSQNLGIKSGLVSTIEIIVDKEKKDTSLTTPDPITLQSTFREMLDKGCKNCYIEASSHAISQERLAGTKIAGTVFTNITHDHLDYHGSFKNYLYAKKKLFDDLAKDSFALLNEDDSNAGVMGQNTKAKKVYYSIKTPSSYKGKIIENSIEGLELEINSKKASFIVSGKFNAYNLVAAYASICELLPELPKEVVLTALSQCRPVEGRMEIVHSKDKVTCVIDYAHTPDALEKLLKSIKENKRREIITLFGCGGDRDEEKRPIMGKIASLLSDKLIITNDNPRSENPEVIANHITKGIELNKNFEVLLDRKEAIKHACLSAKPNDIIVIAGKGHEKYQEIKGIKYELDDVEIAKQALKDRTTKNHLINT